MKHRDLHARKQQLDELFKRVDRFRDDFELQNHWARYLCVLVSGFIEDSVRSLLLEYVTAAAAPNVKSYVAEQLRYFTNAKMDSILTLVGHFNRAWAEQLRLATEGELKDAVDSIIARRHEIAHGKSSGLSYVYMRDYYDRAVVVIEKIEQLCNPNKI